MPRKKKTTKAVNASLVLVLRDYPDGKDERHYGVFDLGIFSKEDVQYVVDEDALDDNWRDLEENIKDALAKEFGSYQEDNRA